MWYNALVVKKANKIFWRILIMNDKFLDELYVLGVFDDDDEDMCYCEDNNKGLKCDCDEGKTCSAFCPAFYDCPYMDD